MIIQKSTDYLSNHLPRKIYQSLKGIQQNLKKLKLAIIVFQTRLNRLEYIHPLIPKLLKKLPAWYPAKYMKSGNILYLLI